MTSAKLAANFLFNSNSRNQGRRTRNAREGLADLKFTPEAAKKKASPKAGLWSCSRRPLVEPDVEAEANFPQRPEGLPIGDLLRAEVLVDVLPGRRQATDINDVA